MRVLKIVFCETVRKFTFITRMSHSYEEVMLVLHACVSSSKDQMIPLKDIDYDFQMAYGCPVPYRELGFSNLKSFPVNLPCIYIVEDDDGVENAMFHRSRSLTVPDFHFCSVFEKKEITEFDGKSADTSFVSQAEFSKLVGSPIGSPMDSLFFTVFFVFPVGNNVATFLQPSSFR